MPQFNDIAELRSALTSDDPDERAPAYGAVMNEDVQPSAVLQSQPDEAAVESLVDADVIPSPDQTGGRAAAERDEEKAQLLREIRDAVQAIADNTGGA